MKGNYLQLNREQLDFFNNHYSFVLTDTGIATQAGEYNRITMHPLDRPFQAIAVINGRKITFKITPMAMDIWRRKEYMSKYSLVEIQNIINNIIINSSQITQEMIEQVLNNEM